MSFFPVDPIKWVPLPYMKRGVKFLVEHNAAALLLRPGGRKTSITLAAISQLKKQGIIKKVLIIAPLRPCYRVWPVEGKKWKEFEHLTFEILHGPKKAEALKRPADIYVINPEGLDWLLAAEKSKTFGGKTRVKVNPATFKKHGFDTLIIDECFPADTEITTPEGEVAIQSLQVGDWVTTDIGPRQILRKTRRLSAHLVSLKLSTGGSINVTQEHPVFTDLGWLPAQYTAGRRLYSLGEVSELWSGVCSKSSTDAEMLESERRRTLLLEILRASSQVRQQPELSEQRSGVLQGNLYRRVFVECGQRVARRVQEKILRASKISRLAERCRKHWGKWARATPGRAIASDDLARYVYQQLHRTVGFEGAWLSYSLQTRFWRPEHQDLHRSGRGQSLRAEGSGRKERSKAGGTWVESVENFQQDSAQDVWNIEVDEAARFFAEGCLVHNCTKFKHPSSQRFKALKEVLHTFQRRWGLTGSPTANGLLDLFGQMYVLDMGKALGQFITKYKMEYFNCLDPNGWKWVPRAGAADRIYAQIAPLAFRMKESEYPELPILVQNTIAVELPPNARKIYDLLEADLFAKVEDRVIVAANSAAASSKCRQICSGAVYLDPETDSLGLQKFSKSGRDFADVHSVKLDALEDLIEELQGEPLLVGYEFKHEVERLLARLGKDTPWVGGGVSTKRSNSIEIAWNRGEIPVLIGQPQSMGHGLNLQSGNCQNVCWFTGTWDYELDDQFLRRVWRDGNKANQVFVHRIIAKDTVDESQLWALRSKDRGQKALYNALEELAKRRRK